MRYKFHCVIFFHKFFSKIIKKFLVESFKFIEKIEAQNFSKIAIFWQFFEIHNSVAVSIFSILDMGGNIGAFSRYLYVLSLEKSARKSFDPLQPIMTEKYKNDPYNSHVVMQAKYIYNQKKSIKNQFAIFQENEQLGFSFKRILKLWTRTNKSLPSVFVDTFFIPIAAWSSVWSSFAQKAFSKLM